MSGLMLRIHLPLAEAADDLAPAVARVVNIEMSLEGTTCILTHPHGEFTVGGELFYRVRQFERIVGRDDDPAVMALDKPGDLPVA